MYNLAVTHALEIIKIYYPKNIFSLVSGVSKLVVPNWGAIYNDTQGVPRVNTFFNISLKILVSECQILKANCYGLSTGCRKLHLPSVGCRKPKKVGKHCSKWSTNCDCVGH